MNRFWRIAEYSGFVFVLLGLLFSGSAWALLWALVVACFMAYNWRQDHPK